MQHEEWRPVTLTEYREHYEVSSLGRVRRSKSERIMAPDFGRRGYGQVKLSVNAKQKRVKVYHLVAWAFHSATPTPTSEINHIDGNPRNNSAINLEWTSRRGNALHATRVLGRNRGENASNARLTDEDVRRIRSLIGKKTPSEIAAEYGVTDTHIAYIRDRKAWSHLA